MRPATREGESSIKSVVVGEATRGGGREGGRRRRESSVEGSRCDLFELGGRAGVGDSSTREEIAELERGGHTRTTTLQVY